MARFHEISFSLNPMAALKRRIVAPSLRFDELDLVLKRDASGRNNWTFRKSEGESAWEVVIRKLVLIKGTVRLVDAIKKADIRSELHTLDETGKEGYGMGWKASGTFNGEPVSGSGEVGSSGLAGSLEFRSREPLPLLAGSLSSNLLRFEDLAPLIGADSKASQAKRGAEVRQPPGKAFPAAPSVPTSRWTEARNGSGRKCWSRQDTCA